jgi:hypothetical protein
MNFSGFGSTCVYAEAAYSRLLEDISVFPGIIKEFFP